MMDRDNDNNAARMYPTLLLEILDEQDEMTAVVLDPEEIRAAAMSVLDTAGVTAGKIEIVLASDEMIHELNREFLKHDEPTDVISFVMESDLENGYLEGEVVISSETAAALAADYHTTPVTECMLYIVHGLLHLVGYDDCDVEDRLIMQRREREVLAGLGFDLSGTYHANDPLQDNFASEN